MRTLPRPIAAAIATSVVTLGFLSPWLLGMVQPDLGAELGMQAQPERRVTYAALIPLMDAPASEVDEAPVDDAPPVDDDGEDAESSESSESSDDAIDVDGGADAAREGATDGLDLDGVMVRGPALQRGIPGGKGSARKGDVQRSRKTRTSRARPRKTCLPPREDIAEVNELAHRVEDSLVSFYANHLIEAEKLAATYWSKGEDGEVRGFKLRRMDCGSILHAGGFRNGDTVTHINGQEITTYREGVAAYLKLRQKHILWVDIIRRGEPVRLDFVLVEDGTSHDERDEEDPLYDPSALVEAELLLEALPRIGGGKEIRQARRSAKKKVRATRL